MIKGNIPALLGRDWLSKLKLDQAKLLAVNSDLVPNSVTAVLAEHASLFSNGYGMIKDFKSQIHIKENMQPKFCKARPILL